MSYNNNTVALLSNTVVLLPFLLRKARLEFLDVIFSILIFFNTIIQKSACYWVIVQVHTALMLSKSEKIIISLNSKQKSLCQLATIELFAKETKKRETARKWQKRVSVCWCLILVVFNLFNHAYPYFFSLMVTDCSEENPFSRFRRIKNELKGRNVPGEVVHKTISALKVTNLGKQILMNS